MQSLVQRIRVLAAEAPEGRIFASKALLHLGNRAAVDQALSRLAREGVMLRVGRGRYVTPVATRFGGRPPALEPVVKQLAEETGEVIVPSGAAAANELGLTTQVPIRSVLLTSGRSRRLQLGRQVVELRHAPAWQVREPASKAGQAIRALAWLGPAHAREAAEQLKGTLPSSELYTVLAARANLPTWLATIVSEVFADAQEPERASAHG